MTFTIIKKTDDKEAFNACPPSPRHVGPEDHIIHNREYKK